MKFAVISHILPPSSSGQAMVLYRLLKDIDPEGYCLISPRRYDNSPNQGYAKRLAGRYYKILPEPIIRQPKRFTAGRMRFIGSIIRLMNLSMALAGIPSRGLQIARILRREKCTSVVACTADFVNIPAGYLASLLAGIPYYPYIFDYYSYQWTEPLTRFFASIIEPRILRGAKGVLVPNEHLRDELKNRYGIEPVVIHNPCETSGTGSFSWPFSGDEISIVYTGAVYYVHYDAFRNLVAAINRLGRSDVTLHIYTSDSPSVLESEGIKGPVVYHDHLELSEALDVQRRADILFLPLAFNSDNPEIIRTSSPGKMGEYLACGRPVLVHSPGDSFVSWYFEKYGSGAVVGQSDVSALTDALGRIIDDASFRDTIVERALLCAGRDFDLDSIKASFLEAIGKDS